MKRSDIINILVILAFTLVTGCQREINNPFDPECPKEIWTPTGFTAVQQGNSVVLSWSQKEKNISGFRIERKVGSGSWANVNSPDKNSASWTDSDLTGGQLHEYKLMAYAGSNNSNAVTAQVTPILAPLATTLAATVTGGSTSAILNGVVNAYGLSTTVIFEYGETLSYGKTVAANPGSLSGTTPTSLNASITGLTPGTTYHFRVKATNSSGITYSSDLSFTISCILPTAVTLAATSVTGTSATLNAQVNANLCNTNVTFEYGETTSYGSTVAGSPGLVSGGIVANVSAGITVVPGKTYYFRVKAVNAAGTVNGAGLSFSSVCLSPSATTLAATNITSSLATLNGQVNGNGCNTTVTFEYGETTSYGMSIAANPGTVTGSSVTNVSGTINITAGKIYHFRIKTVNSTGTTYGTDLTISPYCASPSAITLTASGVTSSSATLNGQVNANFCSTTVTFEYGETSSYGQSVTATPGTVAGNTMTNVSAAIAGLAPGKTYHFRVKALNLSGIIYSNDAVFSTTCVLPAAVILAATNVGSTTATLNGQVNANDCITSVTFEYGETLAYGSVIAASPASVSGNSLVIVNAAINITVGKSYFYRIKAVNAAGTTYSNYLTFTSGCNPPLATTLTPSGITSASASLNGQANANGCNTTVSFDFGESVSYGQSVSASPGMVTGNTLTNVSAALSGLLPGKTYHYRVKSVNSSGTTLGSDAQFTTPCQIPAVVTFGITNQTATTVVLNAQVNPNGCSATIMFDFGETTLYGTSVVANPTNISGNSVVNVSATINITSGRTYHYRARALNSAGSNVGNDMLFSTTCPVPSGITTAATNITNTTARLNGQAKANGNCTANISFEYGLTNSYGTTVPATPGSLTGSNVQNVYADISGLQTSTIYHYRIVASNTTNIVRGSDMTFTTPEDEPFATKTEIFYDPFNGLISGFDWDNGRVDFTNGYTLWAEIAGGYYNLFYNYETFVVQEFLTAFTNVASGKNFELETSIRVQKSSHDGTAAGIISTAGLSFDVNGNWFNYYFLNDGTIKIKLNNTELFTKSSGVSDPKSFNTLKVARVGADYYFYLNRRLLSRVSNVTGIVSKIGFFVAGGSQADFLRLQVEGANKSLTFNNFNGKAKEKMIVSFPLNN